MRNSGAGGMVQQFVFQWRYPGKFQSPCSKGLLLKCSPRISSKESRGRLWAMQNLRCSSGSWIWVCILTGFLGTWGHISAGEGPSPASEGVAESTLWSMTWVVSSSPEVLEKDWHHPQQSRQIRVSEQGWARLWMAGHAQDLTALLTGG